MTGKTAGSPAYWRYAGDRECSQAAAGPGQRNETFGHGTLPSSTVGQRHGSRSSTDGRSQPRNERAVTETV
jgi:hypothetical protein